MAADDRRVNDKRENLDPEQPLTAENVGQGAAPAGSVTDLGLMSGSTTRNLGDATIGGMNPVTPGSTTGGMSVADNIGVTAGITGTGATGTGDANLGARVAETDGGASAGANNGGIGDYASGVRPNLDAQQTPHYDLNADGGPDDVAGDDGDLDREDIEELMDNTSGRTSGRTIGGTTDTDTGEGGSHITTLGDALGATATVTDEDDTSMDTQ